MIHPVLLPILTALASGDTRPFRQAYDGAVAAGGHLFEVIAGAPFADFGLRAAFQPTAAPEALAEALGQIDHPWGTPTWIGLRRSLRGEVRTKAYHALPTLDDRCPAPPEIGLRFLPVMASLDGDSTEVYLRVADEIPWSRLAEPAAALLDAATPRFAPRPRPAAEGFCVSFAWRGRELDAITLYADSRCLPDDRRTREAWVDGLDEVDRTPYEAMLAGVRSTGRRPARCWHGMLAWQVKSGGAWRRAASLRPAPPTDPL